MSTAASDYELVDFGDGRKLERFSDAWVDRPSVVAIGAKSRAPAWRETTAKFLKKTNNAGTWAVIKGATSPWLTKLGGTTFQLRLSESGQVGVFPEQAGNWHWIRRCLRRQPQARVLNLFGYTGGSTIAAAQAGARVVHVDAAPSVVKWARTNAKLNAMESAPIRWIVEDAPKFVQREIRRGNKYEGIILDPPSYGQGPKGETWKLKRDLLELLINCKAILAQPPLLFMLSCHTPGFGPAELSAMACECLFGSCAMAVRGKDLSLATSDGRRLAAGAVASWP